MAPLDLMHGALDPDEATVFLSKTPMKGGIVDLPGVSSGPYEAMLRAADHGKPLVNAVSGFIPPGVVRLSELAGTKPIPDALLDHLESIPASYLVFHETQIDPRERPYWHDFLARGVDAGRLRFIGRFDGRKRNDLYAVLKTEPAAAEGTALPWKPPPVALVPGAGTGMEDESLRGSVDSPPPDGEVRGPLTVHGWARMPDEDLDVTIVIDGEYRPPASFRRTSRPDVARALPRMGNTDTAGYEAVFEPQAGDEGPHELMAVLRSRDGRVRHYPVRTFHWKP